MFIEKVINSALQKRYEECSVGNEVKMFHGSDPTVGTSIEQIGLSSQFSRRSAFGKGNYYSPYISTSMSYMTEKFEYFNLYYCDVKLGVFDKNHSGNNADIFVAFDDAQSNIKYRIGFERQSVK